MKNDTPSPLTWDKLCEKAGWAASILMSQIIYAEYQRRKTPKTGADVMAEGLRNAAPLRYQPDPSGRHKMKLIYYAVYRILAATLRLWSPFAQWLDARFWIKVGRLGDGLGAVVGIWLLRAQLALLRLLKDSGGSCVHPVPDREAAARIRCILCQERDLEAAVKISRYLESKLERKEAELRKFQEELVRRKRPQEGA